ncbi:LysM domain-containing protein [Fluviicoccus keumensis]|uniref:LysM domain-containing protein n=1 Tax=Fluviicoccus keumensis TaxID=1435465 RepID=A0A4Q7YPM9_9GAMM|nr:LysM peptidoglycan-binding domain-containing protein [Fluviicoccus keumensis]RZU38665.1 LysM domain-containing protein [Fluviicoccus keumensis]
MKKPVLLLVAGLLAGSAMAASPKPVDVKDTAPERYTVQKGDTLWDISNRYLKDPWRWPEIWEVNPQVRNPHLIYPGDKLVLCRIQDRNVVAVDTGGGCADVAQRLTNKATGRVDGDSGKLLPQIRSEPMSVAIPAVPLQAIRAFLSGSRVVGPEDFERAPYVLAGLGHRIIAGAGEQVYARGKGLAVGDNYGVYRRGNLYLDPDTQEILGIEAMDIGAGSITAVQGDVGTLSVARTTQEVRIEDRLLLSEAMPVTPVFHPTNPENVKPGRILQVMNSLGSGGLNSIIVVNRGERDGVVQGHTFAVYQHGGVVRDRTKDELVQLPSERSGLAMVFRTFNKVSYAIVLKASTVVKQGDEIRPPVSGD